MHEMENISNRERLVWPCMLSSSRIGANDSCIHDFKYSDLFKATEDEISAIAWCQNNGLIAKDKMCASCSSPTALRERNTVKNKGFYFRCTLRSCRKEISVRKDTWFEGSHLYSYYYSICIFLV